MNILLILDIEGCGKIKFSWIKSCGDLNLPLKGLNIDLKRNKKWERIYEDG